METLLITLMVITGIFNLICYVSVLIQMWTENMTLGICCLVGTFCTGLGGLALFIWGWCQHELRPTMTAWTIGQVIMAILWLSHGGL